MYSNPVNPVLEKKSSYHNEQQILNTISTAIDYTKSNEFPSLIVCKLFSYTRATVPYNKDHEIAL